MKNNIKLKLLCGCIMAASLLGCAYNGNSIKTTPNISKSFYGTHMFIGECHTNLADVEGENESLVGTAVLQALAVGAVKTGVDEVGKSLESAAKDNVLRTTVIRNLTSTSKIFSTINTKGKDKNICMQIVRGQFEYSNNVENSYINEFSVDNSIAIQDSNVIPQRPLTNLKLVNGTEELYIEILPVVHKQFISFTPLEVRYKGYTPNDNQKKNPRELALSIGYSLADNDVFLPKSNHNNRLIKFETLLPNKKNIFVTKYVTDDGRLSLVNQTQWLNLPTNQTQKLQEEQPITLVATVLETRKAGRFASFTSKAFTSNKQGIELAAVEAVQQLEMFKASASLEKEKITYENAKLNNKEAYLNAVTSVLIKKEELQGLCESGSSTEINIRGAQIALYSAQKSQDIAAISVKENRLYDGENAQKVTGKCDL